MERLGGVIRYSGNKQIVGWLREGTDLSRTNSDMLRALGIAPQFASNLLGTGLILNIALSGATLLTTIHRFNQLSQEMLI